MTAANGAPGVVEGAAKPKLLDLFCGAGGAGMGYHMAGFDVTGVDIVSQPHYPFAFIHADALDYLAAHGHEYDVIHASPPCQKYSLSRNLKHSKDYPDLVAPVRELLKALNKPYIIENVVGAPLVSPAQLCGLSFNLKVKRHRLFETSFFFLTPTCQCQHADYYVIFGHEVRARTHGRKSGRKNQIAVGRAAMGIDWMNRGELSQAIPPAYTEYIGRQLRRLL